MRLRATRLAAIAGAVAPRVFRPADLQKLGVPYRAWPVDAAYEANCAAGFSGSGCKLWQDSAKTTPVTAMEQPVGCRDCMAGSGGVLTQATAANRPVISRRLNLLTATDTLATQSVTVRAASHRLKFSGAGSVTLSGAATGTYSAGAHSITTTAGTLTITVSGAVTSADLRLTIDVLGLPDYQSVRSATDYDEAGIGAFLVYNGTNSFMSGALDLSSVDAVTVVVGAVKMSDAAVGVLFETSLTSGINAGAVGLLLPAVAGAPRSTFRSTGTSTADATTLSYAAPHKAVWTGIGRIGTDTSVLRVNGAQAASSSSDQGIGNYGNYTAYVGARAGTSLFFTGREHGIHIFGKLETEAYTKRVERYAAKGMGVAL